MQHKVTVEILTDPLDLERIYDLRYEVLRQPLGLPRTSAIFAEDIHPTTTHYLAKSNGNLIGCVTLVVSTTQRRTQLRGMAIKSEWQKQGIGQLLLNRVQTPELKRTTTLWCNARQSAVGFYTRNGWSTCGEYFEIESLGPHMVMVWMAEGLEELPM